MSRIEKGLHEHHARLQEQAQSNAALPSGISGVSSATAAAIEAPFAKVNNVVAGSPAESAGLQVGDSITKFGWVDWTNHDKLARLTQVVSQNEGVSQTEVLEAAFALSLYCPALGAWTKLTGYSSPSR